jgi:hypothetical protein
LPRAFASGLFGRFASARLLSVAAAPPGFGTSRTEPCETLSPTFTFISITTPASGDGISIVALSDSSETSDCSLATVSPGLTSIR